MGKVSKLCNNEFYFKNSSLFSLNIQADIAASLPKGDSSASSATGAHVQQLKELMRQVEQTKKERTQVEEEFKGATIDMQSKFLQALAAEGFLDNERIINSNIDEVYGPLRTQVAEIVVNQQSLIEQIQVRLVP